MKKYFEYLLLIALAVILILPMATKAATTAKAQAQINAIMQQIQALQQQVAQLQAQAITQQIQALQQQVAQLQVQQGTVERAVGRAVGQPVAGIADVSIVTIQGPITLSDGTRGAISIGFTTLGTLGEKIPAISISNITTDPTTQVTVSIADVRSNVSIVSVTTPQGVVNTTLTINPDQSITLVVTGLVNDTVTLTVDQVRAMEPTIDARVEATINGIASKYPNLVPVAPGWAPPTDPAVSEAISQANMANVCSALATQAMAMGNQQAAQAFSNDAVTAAQASLYAANQAVTTNPNDTQALSALANANEAVAIANDTVIASGEVPGEVPGETPPGEIPGETPNEEVLRSSRNLTTPIPFPSPIVPPPGLTTPIPIPPPITPPPSLTTPITPPPSLTTPIPIPSPITVPLVSMPSSVVPLSRVADAARLVASRSSYRLLASSAATPVVPGGSGVGVPGGSGVGVPGGSGVGVPGGSGVGVPGGSGVGVPGGSGVGVPGGSGVGVPGGSGVGVPGGALKPPVVPVPASVTVTPIGWLDSANCNTFSGWACDSDNYATPIDVHFYKDGLAGGGGVIIGAVTAGNYRGDLVSAGVCGGNGYHGFTFTPPASLKDGLPHSIYAYGINIGPVGANPLLNGSPKTITCGTPLTHRESSMPLTHCERCSVNSSYQWVSFDSTDSTCATVLPTGNPVKRTCNCSCPGNVGNLYPPDCSSQCVPPTIPPTPACSNGATNYPTCTFSCSRCSWLYNYQYATFNSSSQNCSDPNAVNTNVVRSCRPDLCGIAPGYTNSQGSYPGNQTGTDSTTGATCTPPPAPATTHCERCSVNSSYQWVSFDSTDSTCATVLPSGNPVKRTCNCNCPGNVGNLYPPDCAVTCTPALAPSGQYSASILENIKARLDQIQKAINDLYR